MADRFFHGGLIDPGPLTMEGPEAHHLGRVMRLKPGAVVVLFNGNGAEYTARIDSASRSRLELTVLEKLVVEREVRRRVIMACPLPKGDRAQFLIEKLTELGVVRYIPLRTQRSVVHPGEGKTDKLLRYVIEASKQCGRNVLMEVTPNLAWAELVGAADLPQVRCMADPGGSTRLSGRTEACVIAVGPEGGWTEEEVQLGITHGWERVSLGPSILRIETAALAAAVLAIHC